MIPLFKERFGISSAGSRVRSQRSSDVSDDPFAVAVQAPFCSAWRKVPISTDRWPVFGQIFSHATISTILGRPKTRDMPPSLNNSAVDSETHGSNSLSASAGPSCARPMNARRDELPQTRITDTTAVKTPSGERAKIILSRRLMDSERNCLVSRSPNKVIRGAWIHSRPC